MIAKLFLLGTVGVLALPLVHPFGPVRQQRSQGALPDMPLIARSCQNCHSERTEWPLYSYLPGASWLIEKDVAEARKHLNLSQWEHYSSEEKRDLLARIGAEVRTHEMPPARYTMLHPEAHLSDSERQAIYDWTKAERRKLRSEK